MHNEIASQWWRTNVMIVITFKRVKISALPASMFLAVIDHSSLILRYYGNIIYLDREQVFEDALKKNDRLDTKHGVYGLHR